MSITIAATIPTVSTASTLASDVVLQPGQVVTAQVVQVLGADQVQIAIGGQTIQAATQVPLQIGQSLQLQVSQTADGIGLAIVNQPSTPTSQATSAGQATSAAPATSDAVTLAPSLAATLASNATTSATAPVNPLTPAETLAVTLAAQTAATQQTSLAPLFANLGVAATLSLPLPLQQAVAQVLAQQTPLDPSLNGTDLQQAFQSSGILLESAIASGSGVAANVGPDLKAALIVLRQTISTALASPASASSTAAPAVVAQGVSTGASQSAVSSDAAVTLATTPDASIEPVITCALPQTATANPAQPGAALVATVASALAQDVAAQTPVSPITILADAAASDVQTPAPIAVQAGPAASTQTSAQAAAVAVAHEILDFVATNATAQSTAVPADAAARAAANNVALSLLQEAVQATPLSAANLSRLLAENSQALALLPVFAGTRNVNAEAAEPGRTNIPPPPVAGGLPSAQPVAPATLSPHSPLATTLQHLLSDTDGALSRQTLLQIASLPGQVDPSATRVDANIPRWNFEIPFATPKGTAMAQFEISRDGGRDVDPAKQVWRARFSLNIEPAGPVHALVSLKGDRTSVRMWAERPATAAQLRAGLSQLSQALSRAELTPGDIVVRDGAPSQPTPAPAGHFLDRAS